MPLLPRQLGFLKLCPESLIERIWTTEESPEEETVKAHIKTLRQKLRSAGSLEAWSETVHG
ncbi:MAG: winged helix-turn-helix domain-containing protein [Cyanobacteriota bacterium]|nr:winged helix-turn-helix domain-containing protein [Cyanobacteriota bacterium]